MPSTEADTTPPYETERLLAEYLLFHFGTESEILPAEVTWPAGMRDALGFPVRTVSHFQSHAVERALDLGCAVGRSTWELARSSEESIGIDFSYSFIRAANLLREGKSIAYPRLEEAGKATMLEASCPPDIDPGRLTFLQGDAMDLPSSLGAFDRVHAANLLCRLPDPERLLQQLPALVRPGGELVLATPCTWLEDFTPASRWPSPDTITWLFQHLEQDFDFASSVDEPFLIRETARKFQWTRSLVTVWRRKP